MSDDQSYGEDVPDAALASLAQAGDIAALSMLLERHAPLVSRVARRVVGDDDVDDVVQEAALAAFLNIRSLVSPERFAGWYCGIVVNHCRMHLRKMARARDVRSLDGAGIAPIASAATVAEERALLSEVIDALRCLSDEQRRAALLVYFDGLGQKEAAAMLGVSVGAVKARLHRARNAINSKVAMEPAGTRIRRRRRMTEVEVYDVFMMKGDEAKKIPVQATVLLREKGEGRVLPMFIGGAEGMAIAFALENKETARPITPDLTKSLLDAVSVTVESVKVSKLVSDTFYAVVSISNGSGTKSVDARPSDAINLALRAGAPLFVDEAVLEEASTSLRTSKPERTGSGAIVSGYTKALEEGQATDRESIMNAWRELGLDFEEGQGG